MLRNLIIDPELANEFIIYHLEAIQIDDKEDSCYALLQSSLNEKMIADNFSELDSLQLTLNEEAQRLQGCMELIKQTSSLHKTELDFQLSATIEEADAKIIACKEIVTPQVNRITRKYNQKIKSTIAIFDKKNKTHRK
jgi:hypothetical protein